MFCEKGKVEKVSRLLKGDVKRCVAEVKPTEAKSDPQKVEAQPEQKMDLGRLWEEIKRDFRHMRLEGERAAERMKNK